MAKFEKRKGVKWMVKDHLQSEIVRLLDLYGELLKQHDFNKAGDLYRIFMFELPTTKVAGFLRTPLYRMVS